MFENTNFKEREVHLRIKTIIYFIISQATYPDHKYFVRPSQLLSEDAEVLGTTTFFFPCIAQL